MTARKTSTDLVELTGTHKLVLALKRLNGSAGGFDAMRWRRALYHAISMTHVASREERTKIREALGLA